MKDFMETWGAPLIALVMLVLVFAAPLILGGCEHFKQVAKEIDVGICYVHPDFGRVCIQYDGKVHISADVVNDPAKLEAVREWIKDKLPAGVSLEPVSKPSSSTTSGTDPPK